MAPSRRRISASAVRPVASTSRSASASSPSGRPVAHGAGLEHHHADRVGDDVVQLARDPRALLGGGEPRGLGGALLGSLGLGGALAQGEAGQPGEPEHDREREQLGAGVGRVVEATIAAPPSTIARPARRCTRSGNLAEQERRRQPGGVDARRERDQAPVGERHRGREQPDRRGRRERRAGGGRAAAGPSARPAPRRGRPGLRRVRRVLAQQDLDRALDRREDDQDVEPALLHAPTLPHPRRARLLLRSEIDPAPSADDRAAPATVPSPHGNHRSPHPAPVRAAATPAADAIPQYSLRKILGVWASAMVPMGLLAWVVAPWLADSPQRPEPAHPVADHLPHRRAWSGSSCS